MTTPPMPARTPSQRREDSLRRLEQDTDAWVATADPHTAAPYLVPLSFLWDGATLLIATPEASPTGRNLHDTGKVRLGIGPTRDLVLIEGTAQAISALPAETGDAFAAKTGFDPRELPGYRYFRIRPQRMQAWREANELAGRELMRDGHWVVPGPPADSTQSSGPRAAGSGGSSPRGQTGDRGRPGGVSSRSGFLAGGSGGSSPRASTAQVEPVGWVESPLADRDAAPRQADEGAPPARIVFRPEFRAAAADLRVGAEVVLLTWLHQGRREVLTTHPRGDLSRPSEGVFSTRSPDRPNPIGLHTVTITGAGPDAITVDSLEAIDGTPVLDVKPLLGPSADR
jgi:tRNA-Thr(GGU) m(6)t(6)A37 methyltransferase TsaA